MARKKPTQGSFKVNFDSTGRVKTFEVKGAAADAFYRGLVRAHAAEDLRRAEQKKPKIELECTGCHKRWRLYVLEEGKSPPCPSCGMPSFPRKVET